MPGAVLTHQVLVLLFGGVMKKGTTLCGGALLIPEDNCDAHHGIESRTQPLGAQVSAFRAHHIGVTDTFS